MFSSVQESEIRVWGVARALGSSCRLNVVSFLQEARGGYRPGTD